MNNQNQNQNQNLLINKYQPLFLKDFQLDPEMVYLLETFIATGQLNIMFVGDTNSGKTSILNAVMREYFKNCSKKEMDENVLIINSLKEQGIHYYRNEVPVFCQTCCSIKNKKKMMILDDIDTINEQSQQVFRNCLDKYENKVSFLASCSNKHKVIDNLQSRFFLIKLEPLSNHNLHQIANNIIEKEHLNILKEAQDFMVNISNHSVKSLIHYLEKFKLLGESITLDVVQRLCTDIHFSFFDEYTLVVQRKELHSAIQLLLHVYHRGYSVMDILDNYFLYIKTTLKLNETEKYAVIPFICEYISIFYNIHEDEVELAFFTNQLIKVFSL